MKKIEAIVRPRKMEEIREALFEIGVLGMTITEVKGVGKQRGSVLTYRGSGYEVCFVPKIKLEIVVEDSRVERAIAAIIASAKTGEIGDGKVFISLVDAATRVRTEETGTGAI